MFLRCLSFSVSGLVLLNAASALTVPAAAETGKTPGQLVPEEIIISAPYQRQRFDVLAATSVLSGEKLDQSMNGTIGETLAKLPGVESSYFGPGASRPILRGLGGERVRIVTDGVGGIDASGTSPDHAVTGEPITAERIEVLRGPASLLYGSSAAGGVVNVIDGRIPSALPDGAADGQVYLRYGAVDQERAGAATATVGLGERFAFHADGFYRKTDDMKIPGYAFSAAKRAAAIAAAQAAGDPAPVFEKDEVANTDLENKGGAVGATALFDRGFLGASLTRFESDYGVPSDEADPVRIDLGQTKLGVKGQYDFDGFVEQAKLRFVYGDYKHRELEGGEIGTTFLNKGFEGRLELVQRQMGDRKGAFGLQVRKRDFKALGDEAFVPPTATWQTGLFALQETQIAHWRFEASGRYEYSNIDAASLAASRDFHSISLSIGASHTWHDWLRVGLQIYRTERAPAAEELFSNGPHFATGVYELGNADLGEEVAYGGELSLKAEGRKVTGSVNLYVTEYKDFINEQDTGQMLDGLPVFRFMQTDARFYGAEAEMTASLYEGDIWDINLDAGADWVRATDLDHDMPLPRIPAKSATLGVEATQDYWTLRGEVELTAAQNRLAAYETPTSGFALINADLNWRPFGQDKDITLMLQGRNLTGEDARRHTSFLKDVLPLPGRSARLAARIGF